MKTLCALIGAFFLVAGLAILLAGPPKTAPRAGGRSRAARPSDGTGHRPLLWEADVARSRAAGGAADAVSRNR